MRRRRRQDHGAAHRGETKELDEKIAKGGAANIKYAKPGRSDIWP
jgi:hypothetical protein